MLCAMEFMTFLQKVNENYSTAKYLLTSNTITWFKSNSYYLWLYSQPQYLTSYNLFPFFFFSVEPIELSILFDPSTSWHFHPNSGEKPDLLNKLHLPQLQGLIPTRTSLPILLLTGIDSFTKHSEKLPLLPSTFPKSLSLIHTKYILVYEVECYFQISSIILLK